MRNIIHATAAAFLMPILMASAITAVASEAEKVTFKIPAQPLNQALNNFAKQADLRIVFDTADAEGLQATALDGTLTPDEALKKLLEPTQLKAEYLDAKTIAIHKGVSTPTKTSMTLEEGESAVSTGALRLARNTGTTDPQEEKNEGTESALSSHLNESRNSSLQEILVTGSRIRQRAGAVTSSPVIVFDRKKFDEIGAVDVATVLRQLPQSPSNFNDAAGNTSSAGSVSVQLRGLPSNATLVLIDGRRAMQSPSAGGAVDINTIPLSAVERIEVLTDGASAIYGADAVAGVVNIILRKNVNTMTASARYGNTTRSDSSEKSGTLVFGHTYEKLSLLMSAEVFDRNPMFQSDLPGLFPSQDFTSLGGPDRRTLTLSTPGTILAVSGNLPGVGAPRAILPTGQNGVGLTTASLLPTAGQQNLTSTAANSNILSGSRRYGATARVTYDFAPGWQTFGSFMYADNDQLSARQGYGTSGITIPAANPFNPFGTAVRFAGAVEQGDLPGQYYDVKNTVKEFRGLAGIARDFGNGWDIETTLAFQHDTSGAFSYTLNTARLQTYLNTATTPTTALNLFTSVPYNNTDVLVSMFDSQVFAYRQVSESADTRLRGPVFSLPGGAVQLVAGAEGFRNTYSASAISLLVNDARRLTWAGFTELSVPIFGQGNARRFVQDLTLNLAGRYDHYSDFGDTTNPKVSLIYKPLKSFFMRGSWGTFFRAPTMNDTYQPLATGSTLASLSDPRRGNTSFTAVTGSGGNLNLQPEEGETWNAGLGWQPSRELSLTLDYWNLRQQNVNGRLGLQVIMNYEALFPQFIYRDPASATDIAAGRPGPVVRIDSVPLNFGLRTMDGVDVGFQYGTMTALGHFDLSILATRSLSFVEALIPGGQPVERLGYSNLESTLYPAKWKGATTLGWGLGGWAASLTGRFLGKTIDFDRLTNIPIREMGSVWTFDAAVSYDFDNINGWLRGTQLHLGGQNIFDRPPEFSFASIGINTIRDDLRGRFLYIDLSKKF